MYRPQPHTRTHINTTTTLLIYNSIIIYHYYTLIYSYTHTLIHTYTHTLTRVADEGMGGPTEDGPLAIGGTIVGRGCCEYVSE